ncbi:hypothetical protein RN001_003677 [Aquatica leii]|uniref:Uncharacterized protein n=1 Tax=Aquatica leii TaxID=1421715 RepID=A0AAN7PRE6_9COLE|nr:hypothetical protein RN001_003677 [Aquatica leii]
MNFLDMASWVIVETKEPSGVFLSAVPSKWVVGKYLYWPNVKTNEALTKLKQNGSSTPLSTWNKLYCKVKKSGLLSSEEAEQEISEMSEIIYLEEPQPVESILLPAYEQHLQPHMVTIDEPQHNQNPLQPLIKIPSNHREEQQAENQIDILKNMLSEMEIRICEYIKNRCDEVKKMYASIETKVDKIIEDGLLGATKNPQDELFEFHIIDDEKAFKCLEDSLGNAEYRNLFGDYRNIHRISVLSGQDIENISGGEVAGTGWQHYKPDDFKRPNAPLVINLGNSEVRKY